MNLNLMDPRLIAVAAAVVTTVRRMRLRCVWGKMLPRPKISGQR